MSLRPMSAPPSLETLLDLLGKLRYGMPTSQKEAVALQGSLPGAPPVRGADAAEAQRYAAGYLHARQYPQASRLSVPLAALIRGLFGESPELQSYAAQGANMGRLNPNPR